MGKISELYPLVECFVVFKLPPVADTLLATSRIRASA
jgi:hypothetical protein